MDFERGKAKIMDALLAHGGLQRLVDVGADVIGNPIFVCDLAAQVLALSQARSDDQEFWDRLFPNGKLDGNAAVEVGRAGIYERIFSADKPVEGRFGFYDGRFVGARIRSKEDVIGMATLVERSPLNERDGELLVILCQAITLEMTWQGMRGHGGSALSDAIVSALEGRLSGDELDLKAQGVRLGLDRRMRVVVTGLESGHSGVLLSFAMSMLERRFPNSPLVTWHGRLVMLLDVSHSAEVPLEALESSFANLSIRVGAGRPFEGLSGIAESYRQARVAMDLARACEPNMVLADYDDWCVDDFMHRASELLDLGAYVSPLIEMMRRHDESEGTHLVEALEAYLRCANNAQAAARILGIHKNTMYARLERIQELFGIDLASGETCYSLWLSLRMERARNQKVGKSRPL